MLGAEGGSSGTKCFNSTARTCLSAILPLLLTHLPVLVVVQNARSARWIYQCSTTGSTAKTCLSAILPFLLTHLPVQVDVQYILVAQGGSSGAKCSTLAPRRLSCQAFLLTHLPRSCGNPQTFANVRKLMLSASRPISSVRRRHGSTVFK